MEDLKKKRKLEETTNGETTTNLSQEQLRSLLDPLTKPQLVDLLSKLGCQYPSIAEEIKSVASVDPANRKLFVRGLAWNTTTETLCAAFLKHGEIEEGAVIMDKASGKSRGYGFITYKEVDSTRKALEAPSKLIDGRMAVCTLACEGMSSASSSDQAQRKLYIGGLSPETTSEMLLLFFKKHGDIEEGSVAYDKDTDLSRGFGFITYKTVEAAKKAIDDPHKIVGGRSITVKLADNTKSKVVPTQVLMTPVVHVAGYGESAKPHQHPHMNMNMNAGYTYPGVTPYPHQPLPPAAATPYPQQQLPAAQQPLPAATPYPQQPLPAASPAYPITPQMPYNQYAPHKDMVRQPAAPPLGLAGYPYYFNR